jgi:hypothetical protein
VCACVCVCGSLWHGMRDRGQEGVTLFGGGVTLAGLLEVVGMPHALLELINAVGHCMHYSSLQNAFTPNM